MNEEWKSIPDLPGYEVSNLGGFRSYWKTTGELSETPKNKRVIFNNGFAKVGIRVNGKNTVALLARLVASLFIGDITGKVVIPKDGNTLNCQADNLMILTRKEAGKFLSDKRGVSATRAKKEQAQTRHQSHLQRALAVKEMRDHGETFSAIGQHLGISESGACRIYHGLNNAMLSKAIRESNNNVK